MSNPYYSVGDENEELRAEVKRLREALSHARYFVSKHDMRGHTLAMVDAALASASPTKPQTIAPLPFNRDPA